MFKLKAMALILAGTALVACQSEEEPAEEQAAASESSAQASSASAEEAPFREGSLADILAGDHRSEENRARDLYRNPEATLFFFGLSPTDTVIEINPGGGWYMEVIAPFVNEEGQYIAAHPDPSLDDMPSYVVDQAKQIEQRVEAQDALFGNAEVQFYDPSEPVLGEPGSADKVLTFRNVHNWVNGGQAEAMFKAFADVLKPGGVLGVVQHRADDGSSAEETAKTGYVSEEEVIALAEAAGLSLEERSNLNANPKDTRDHPEGVWTLPPSLALGEERKGEFEAIGESDRMTLKFVKPANDE
ncbi:class I SAM-dependent methyltransferase [Marinimicrobium sp. C2-29]|uniref:class I SAM-dependent methyltransferase n=1 Tax=Marinimicrobium sp. C2-29 TaxID=3139825 RepID=UPI003139AE96